MPLWFKENRYRVNLIFNSHRTTGRSILPIIGSILSGEYIEFVNLVPEYPSITTKFLGIHAAIAKVLHMIGAGSVIDKILWESKRVIYLNPDGTDATLLEWRLRLIIAL